MIHFNPIVVKIKIEYLIFFYNFFNVPFLSMSLLPKMDAVTISLLSEAHFNHLFVALEKQEIFFSLDT